ncbi:hypothetical protein [Halobellus inordinatus]|uniref:hypothetical protein n=1 Tax=Halobellus inordinatus TaxID=1126236 RepID=UPI0021153507|nr:hypothetical protein [Halobellus ramosii]
MSHNAELQRDDATDASEPDDEQSADPEQLQAQVETLQAENQRLREQYAATQQQTYRYTALGLAGVGLLAGVAGVIITPAQQVLFALAGVGLFAAVLTWFLTPEQFIPVTIGHAVYAPLATNLDAVAGELGLSGNRIYLEQDQESRLYIPEGETTAIPDELDSTFTIGESPEETGISLHPTGRQLVDEFEESHSGPLPDTPSELSSHLVEGLVEGLELATDVDATADPDNHHIIFEITDPQFGSLSQFDHPVQSFLAIGIARGLETPVTVERVSVGDDEEQMTVRWAAFSANDIDQ